MADAFRRALATRETSTRAQMARLLEAAERGIREKQDALLRRIREARAAGEPVTAAWLERQDRYQALLLQVQAALSELARRAAPAVEEAQRAAVDAAGQMALAMADAALGTPPEGVSAPTWHRLPQDVLEALAGYAADGSPLEAVLAEIAPDAVQAAREALITGVALGEGPEDVGRRLEGALGTSRARAMTIARTEMHRAAREATRRAYTENAHLLEGWIWHSALDSVTCPACWAMHGTVHGLDETLDDHPNGRCVMVPLVRSWADLTGDADLPDERPAVETGEDAFARLPEERQREVLGPGRWACYVDGVPLSAMVRQETDPRWGTMRRAATVEEIRASAGVGA